MNCLISTQLGLGNAVLFTSFIRTLKNIYPESTMTLYSPKKTPATDFLAYHPAVDIVRYDLEGIKTDVCFLPFLGYHARVLETLFWKHKAKKIISHSLQSPHPVKHALKKAYMDINRLRGVRYVPFVQHQHEVWNYANLLTPLGVDPSLWHLAPDIPETVHTLASTHTPTIPEGRFLAVQCSTTYGQVTPKAWPVAHWVSLLTAIVEKSDLKLVFLGASQETAFIQTIMDKVGTRCFDYSGKTTVLELMGLLKKASGYIGADSGTSHLAAALGKKTVVLWGPSSWARCHPMGSNTHFINLGRACSPCIGTFKLTDAQAYSQCRYEHRCMGDIMPRQVLEKLYTFGVLDVM